MWQKLNRIDIYELKKARIQLINAAQLVSAASRSFHNNASNERSDWLYWGAKDASISCCQIGSKEKINVSLDLEQFVISIIGQNGHIEHLVLSGMTYPMAYGWMKIKLDTFHLDGQKFNDTPPYTIEKNLSPDEEMNMTNQSVLNDLKIYYSNAYFLLNYLNAELGIGGEILIDPVNLSLKLIPNNVDNRIIFGFAPGDQDYLEAYFFIQFPKDKEKLSLEIDGEMGIRNTKGWNGMVYLTSEFITLNPFVEMEKVVTFFKYNINSLFDS